MKRNIYYILFSVFFIATVALLSAGFDLINLDEAIARKINYLMPENSYNYQYLPMKDTIFIEGDEYISISLKDQVAKLYRRDDHTLSFDISSGTDLISKGIKTTEGIFTVQSKIRLGVSRQFNNAELINWIGFYGNIGFHGLRGNGYYTHLGKRPSSHGCVRISREDGDTLYKYTKLATPVIVYTEEPARVLAFKSDNVSNYNYIRIEDEKKLTSYFKKRLDNLYNGYANLDLNDKVVLDSVVLRKLRIFTGLADKISPKQKTIGLTKRFEIVSKDNTYILNNYDDYVENELETEEDALSEN